MTSIAPHITAFLRERLPLERGASPNTCESYAYTFQLLFEFASNRHKVTPSKLYLEQIDAVLVMETRGEDATSNINCTSSLVNAPNRLTQRTNLTRCVSGLVHRLSRSGLVCPGGLLFGRHTTADCSDSI